MQNSRLIYRSFISVIALLLLTGSVYDANGQVNPFDQRHKLSKEERTEVYMPESEEPVPEIAPPEAITAPTVPEEKVTAVPEDSNEEVIVEDIEEPTEVVVEGDSISVDKSESVEKKSILPIVQKKNQSLFLFLMLIAATILTTLTISSNKSLINNILRAVLNDNYLNLMYREQKKTGTFHYYILYFVFAVNAGLFFYFLFSRMVLNEGMPLLWRCIVLVAIVYAVRHLFMNYIAYVYPFQKEAEQYAFTILIFNIFLGLLLLPINVFIAFSPEPISTFFLYGGLAIAIIIYIFRQLRGIFISSRLLINNKFYFLLYLCAVEIAPVLLLIKYSGAYVS